MEKTKSKFLSRVKEGIDNSGLPRTHFSEAIGLKNRQTFNNVLAGNGNLNWYKTLYLMHMLDIEVKELFK